MAEIKLQLQRSKLLGFRLCDANRVTDDARLGGKVGGKGNIDLVDGAVGDKAGMDLLGAKVGGKVGSKTDILAAFGGKVGRKNG